MAKFWINPAHLTGANLSKADFKQVIELVAAEGLVIIADEP